MSARRRRFSLPSPVDFGPALTDDGRMLENPLFRPPPLSPPTHSFDATRMTMMVKDEQQVTPLPQLDNSDDTMLPSATAGPASSSVALPAEMCCPVCLDAFQTPVTLNCSHNVCHDHILDLAVASTAGGVLPHGPSGSFVVHCPKCRRETHFAEGLASVHINYEMQALIEMMLGMMKLRGETAQAQRTGGGDGTQRGTSRPPLPNTTPAVDHGSRSASTSTPLEGGSAEVKSGKQRSGSRGKSVRFAEELDDDDEDGSHYDDAKSSRPPVGGAVKPVKSVLKRPAGSGGGHPNMTAQDSDGLTPRSDAPPASPVGAPRSVRDLERQLQAQREKQREEREKQAQAKLEEFKRQRRVDIERRQRMEAEAEAEAAALHNDANTAHCQYASGPCGGGGGLPRSPAAANGVSPSRKRLLMALRTGRTEQCDNDGNDTAEEDTRQRVHEWMMEDGQAPSVRDPRSNDGALPVAVSSDEVALHLHQLKQFEEASAVLTASTKARRAEDRIKHLFEPLKLKSQEERAASAARKREEAARQLQEREAQEALQCDVEVESRLWEVERDVLRAHDQELSRSEMADIAEQRARAQIAAFRRQQRGAGGGVAPWARGAGVVAPAKPTYTPKLHRLQKLGSAS